MARVDYRGPAAMRVTFVPDHENQDALARAELMLMLRKRGIRNTQVMRAMEQVPRERFVDPSCRELAWSDQALPIDCGQTISQPMVVALATEALDLGPSHTVLEIGTGSGYHAAVLSHIARKVVSVERFRTLAGVAAQRLGRLGITNVEIVVADGTLGYPPRAPYDRIVVNAAVPEVPAALLEQLRVGGVLVAPIGPIDQTQMLTRIERTAGGFDRRDLLTVRFVPLLPGVAAVL